MSLACALELYYRHGTNTNAERIFCLSKKNMFNSSLLQEHPGFNVTVQAKALKLFKTDGFTIRGKHNWNWPFMDIFTFTHGSEKGTFTTTMNAGYGLTVIYD